MENREQARLSLYESQPMENSYFMSKSEVERMTGITRFKLFKKSGGRIYIPQHLLDESDFPFKDGDLLKIEIGEFEKGESTLVLSRPEWWELLDWNQMQDAYNLLPENIREKIRGLHRKAINND